MLFRGLGTGLGPAMIVDRVLEPMEIAHLPYKDGRTYEDYLGLRGIERLGKKKWRRQATQSLTPLKNTHGVDDVVVGGGNSKLLKQLLPGRGWAITLPFYGRVSAVGAARRRRPITTVSLLSERAGLGTQENCQPRIECV
jgi:hypothetical protein